MTSWIIWLIIAIALIVIEVLSQMVWTLCFAIGCLGAIATCFFDGNLVAQIVIMAITAIVAYIALMPWFKRWQENNEHKEGRNARTGMDALLGRHAIVTHAIKPGEMGRARIDGDYWQVKAPGVDHVIERGCDVVVTAYDSIILTVTTAD